MVYVSDRVGEHDFELLRRLVLPNGTGARAGRHGKPGCQGARSPVPACRRRHSASSALPPHPCRLLTHPAVLRCCLPGRPTADCLFSDISRDGQTVLKVPAGALGLRWGLVV